MTKKDESCILKARILIFLIQEITVVANCQNCGSARNFQTIKGCNVQVICRSSEKRLVFPEQFEIKAPSPDNFSIKVHASNVGRAAQQLTNDH